MHFTRSLRSVLLALMVCGIVAQLASAQIPVGTTRTGTFVWDGERWIPADEVPQPPPPPPPQGGGFQASVGFGGVELTVDEAPPPMPVYEQPPCPEPDLIWTPGYWHHGFLGYYWVPGAWVPAPYVGALWTPGYWGFAGGSFGFHTGYWGPHVGFYGGVNYGGGYMGIGFAGGNWNGGHFAYNTAVIRVNPTVVTNVYINKTIVQQTTIVNVTNVSYNGGPNGVQHTPTPEEQTASHETHTAPTSFQIQHRTQAAQNKGNLASSNGGHPTTLADTKPLAAESHPAPAGFKPPPPKPVTELAKEQAPPSAVAAAKTATTKTAAVAKAAPPAPKSTPPPAPKTTPAQAPKTTAPPPSKPVPPTVQAPVKSTPPAPKANPPAPLKPETTNKPVSPAPPKPAATEKPVAPKPEPPAPKPAAKTPPKPATKPAPKPEDKKKPE